MLLFVCCRWRVSGAWWERRWVGEKAVNVITSVRVITSGCEVVGSWQLTTLSDTLMECCIPWAQERCRISPSRFQADWTMLLLCCCVLCCLLLLWVVYSLSIFLYCFVCQSSDWLWRPPPKWPTVWVKKIPPCGFLNFFPNGWEFLINFLHTY